MPSQPRLKLEVIFALTDARVQDSSGNRFRDTFWTFVEGIASSESAQPGDDIERFLRAEEQYYRPFFDRFPFMLENYLLNYMFQNLFPYGREDSPDFAPNEERNSAETRIFLPLRFTHCSIRRVVSSAVLRPSCAEKNPIWSRFFRIGLVRFLQAKQLRFVCLLLLLLLPLNHLLSTYY